MLSTRPILRLAVAQDVPGPRYVVGAAIIADAVSTLFLRPNLVGFDVSVSGEVATQALVKLWKCTDQSNIDNGISSGEGEFTSNSGALEGRNAEVSVGIINKGSFPDVAAWDDVASDWVALMGARAGDLPTLGARVRSFHVRGGTTRTFRGAVKAPTSLSNGFVAVVEKITAPARVSVAFYVEVATG